MACSFPWSCINFRSVSLLMTSLPRAFTDNDAGSGFICICLKLALQFGLWWGLVCFLCFWWGSFFRSSSAHTYAVGLCSFNRLHVAFLTETSHYRLALLLARLVSVYNSLRLYNRPSVCVLWDDFNRKWSDIVNIWVKSLSMWVLKTWHNRSVRKPSYQKNKAELLFKGTVYFFDNRLILQVS